MNYVSQISGDIIGLLFIWSGAVKVLNRRRIVLQLLYIPWMKSPWNRVIAYILPPLEIMLGVGMLFGSKVAGLLCIGVLIIFSLVALVSMQKRQFVPCNCFTMDEEEKFGTTTIIRNGILIALSIAAEASTARDDRLLVLSTAASAIFISLSVIKIVKRRVGIAEGWR